MANKTRKSAKKRYFGITRVEFAAAAILLGAFAFLVLADSGVAYGAASSASMESMMSGTSSQNLTALCNQMMASFGLNQTAIAEMDEMMASGAMSEMMGSMSGMMQMMSGGHTH